MAGRSRRLVVQDGNYLDFVTGQRTDFALEFASRSVLRLLDGAQEVSVRRIEGSRYEVTAQIVHDKPNAQVLDLGIFAYHFIGIEAGLCPVDEPLGVLGQDLAEHVVLQERSVVRRAIRPSPTDFSRRVTGHRLVMTSPTTPQTTPGRCTPSHLTSRSRG